MSFPLADWIMDHETVAHNLSESGMKGQVPEVLRWLERPKDGDPRVLRGKLAELHGAELADVSLTPGASTANLLVLLHLFGEIRRRTGRRPRAGLPVPEYPPLWDVAGTLGYRTAPRFRDADLCVLSNPNNPEGRGLTPSQLQTRTGTRKLVLVDETFREFTSLPSSAPLRREGLWVTGTFTKVYGADNIRVGFVISPPGKGPAFRDHAELWVNRVAFPSVGAALALLEHRRQILRASRSLFERNLAALRRRIPGVPPIAAPVWFDRSVTGSRTDPFARWALRREVLVCAGHFFRDPGGIRVCLTQRSFPEDLEAYLNARAEFHALA
jgi:hypothetical protein